MKPKVDNDTKNRLKRMKREFGKPFEMKTFVNEGKYDQMVIQKNIPFMALCEHHHVAFIGTACVGYIPNGRLVGLSKMGRVVEKFFNPTVYTIQEKGTQQIVDYLQEQLNPLGVMVVIKATHGCIAYRGVKKPSETITSAFKGVFKNKEAREEFLSLIQ